MTKKKSCKSIANNHCKNKKNSVPKDSVSSLSFKAVADNLIERKKKLTKKLEDESKDLSRLQNDEEYYQEDKRKISLILDLQRQQRECKIQLRKLQSERSIVKCQLDHFRILLAVLDRTNMWYNVNSKCYNCSQKAPKLCKTQCCGGVLCMICSKDLILNKKSCLFCDRSAPCYEKFSYSCLTFKTIHIDNVDESLFSTDSTDTSVPLGSICKTCNIELSFTDDNYTYEGTQVDKKIALMEVQKLSKKNESYMRKIAELQNTIRKADVGIEDESKSITHPIFSVSQCRQWDSISTKINNELDKLKKKIFERKNSIATAKNELDETVGKILLLKYTCEKLNIADIFGDVTEENGDVEKIIKEVLIKRCNVYLAAQIE